MIKQDITVGILFFFVVRIEGNKEKDKGSCGQVNITKAAEDIASVRGEQIIKVSFTEADGRSSWEPTTVTVGKMQFEKECKHTKKFNYTTCHDLYWWYMPCGLATPFNLTLNTTVFYKNERHLNVTLDLNNAAYNFWNPDDVKNDTYMQNETQSTSCNFTVEIQFQGQFYYEVKSARGDSPNKESLYVLNLARRESRLFRHGPTGLSYNISGYLKHEVVCPRQNHTKGKTLSKKKAEKEPFKKMKKRNAV
uniref:Putative da-p36 protein n=1 Tax=Rhipicephalus pulchellus TaxID=72859 RepID=L7LQZ4_RHIPC